MKRPKLPVNLLLLLLALPGLLPSSSLAAVEPGEPAPDFTLPLLDTEASVKLSEFRGQWVYVDFWASWCGPCRQSMPLYESLFHEYASQELQILAINLDETREDATGFLAKHPVSYTVLWDPAGNTPREWNLKVMPSSYLLDPAGKLVKAWAGFEDTHIQEIRDVLPYPPSHDQQAQ
jgi:cytochrome c biogenesis protein CcmG/thiol:disulfide interchange protein DsbE